MADQGITLSQQDLREVARYAAESAEEVLELFEQVHPEDARPRDAVDAAWAFARGGRRGKTLRDAARAALRAAGEAEAPAAAQAARAAMAAAAAAYLHPLARAHQVPHILGAAAHAARAAALMAGDDPAVGVDRIEQARRRATPALVEVLTRYPPAPSGGGRVGALLRMLDEALRTQITPPRQEAAAPGRNIAAGRRGVMATRAGGGRRSLIPNNPIDNRVAEVLVPVTDLERARAWYCALLDLPEPELADGCARLDMQGVALTLTAGTDERPRRLPAVVLRSEDVAAAAAFLKRHGIEVVAAGDGWLTFADPDGNTLMVRGPRG